MKHALLDEIKQHRDLFARRVETWEYVGALGIKHKAMPPTVRNAYQRWLGQGQRCGNPKTREYQWYGAKGVRRIWTSRECVNWFIQELLMGELVTPAISRRGDLGHYEIGNVELVEKQQNCSIKRFSNSQRAHSASLWKRAAKPVELVDINNPHERHVFPSANSAGRFLGIAPNNVGQARRARHAVKANGRRYNVTLAKGPL